MKSLLFVAAATTVLATAACAPMPKPQLRAALDCPPTQGDLTRTGQAADGKTCTYKTGEGVEISLQLVPVKGDAGATLQAIEDTLAPPAPASATAAVGDAGDVADRTTDTAGVVKDRAPAKTTTAATRGTASDAAAAAKQAADDAGHTVSATVSVGATDDGWSSGRKDRDHRGKVEVKIDEHGHKVVSGDGETTRVDLPGIHISASDEDANLRIGGIRINANGDDESVHIIRDVRLRGEALSRQKRGIRATFFSSGKNEASGYRFVGYEAAGPKVGPLTVAVVKSKIEINNDDDVARDVRRLVRRNGGV